MNMYISPLERIVLESIQKQENTSERIGEDTNIQPAILQNIIQALVVKGLITNHHGNYSINKNLSEMIKFSVKNKENLILECNEMVRSSIKLSLKNGKDKGFHLKKMALNESQKKLLHAMLYNINSFLEDCHQENKKMKTKDLTVIFWGQNTYDEITQNIMETI